jgi:hypothetical protein
MGIDQPDIDKSSLTGQKLNHNDKILQAILLNSNLHYC